MPFMSQTQMRQFKMKDKFHAQLTGPKEGAEKKWIFLHGLMGSLNNWRTTISKIEKTAECLVYDQRGHGRSFKPDFGYSVGDYAHDLKEIVDELGWKNFYLVGHSMGGRNALRFASLYPECVEKLVIEDIGPEPLQGNEHYYHELLASVPVPFPDRTTARDYFKGTFQSSARVRGNIEHVAQFLNANLEEKPDGTVGWRFSKEGILQTVGDGLNLDQWPEVKNLKMPTLFMRGEQSMEFSQKTYEKVLLSNPIIHGVIIKNAGHWIHADQPEQFFIELMRFVG